MKPQVQHLMRRNGVIDSAIERFSPQGAVGVTARENRLYLDGPIVSTLEAQFWEMFGLELGLVDPASFRRELDKLTGDVEIWINSPGGSVFDASMMQASILDRKKTDTVSVTIGGLAASAASFLAMTGDPVRMAPMAMIMVHESTAGIFGRADDLRRAAGVLDKVNDSLAAMLADRSGMDEKDARGYVREETWWTAAEAVDLGVVDEVLSDSDVDDPQLQASARLVRVAAQLGDIGGIL